MQPTESSAEQPPTRPQGLGLGRRELWLVAGFLSAVLVLDQVVHRSAWGVMVPRVHASNQMQLLAHRMREEPEDVLVVGSSRVQAGVDPNLVTQYLGYHPEHDYEAVRVVLNGMRATLLYHFVRDSLLQRPPTQLLVLGLEARYFYVPPFEADEPLGYRLMGSSRDLLSLNPWTMPASELKALTMAPLRGLQAPWNLHRALSQEAADYVEHLHETRGLPTHNFEAISKMELRRALQIAREIDERDSSYDDLELRESELVAFERTLDLLDDLSCEVVFVRMPVEIEFDVEQRRQLEAFHERVVLPLEERGYRFYDLNEHPELRQPGLFKNPTHVNAAGMRETSVVLARNVVCNLVYDIEANPELVGVLTREAQRQADEANREREAARLRGQEEQALRDRAAQTHESDTGASEGSQDEGEQGQ